MGLARIVLILLGNYRASINAENNLINLPTVEKYPVCMLDEGKTGINILASNQIRIKYAVNS